MNVSNGPLVVVVVVYFSHGEIKTQNENNTRQGMNKHDKEAASDH